MIFEGWAVIKVVVTTLFLLKEISLPAQHPRNYLKGMEGEKQLNYTLILHQIRKKLKLSLLEYCIADSVYHLSNNSASKIPGWCFASKEIIADFLGTTQRTVFSNINQLIEKGLIERDEKTSHLRTTQKWYEEVVLVRMSGEYGDISSGSMKKLHSKVGRNFTPKREETSHNNNKDSNKDKNIIIKDIKNLKRLNELKSPLLKKMSAFSDKEKAEIQEEFSAEIRPSGEN